MRLSENELFSPLLALPSLRRKWGVLPFTVAFLCATSGHKIWNTDSNNINVILQWDMKIL